MILRNLLWVGLGSLAGGALRYLIAQLTRTHGFDGSFPWGTFIVNLTGSFLLGLLFGLSTRYSIFPDEIRLLLMVGFCGGFTTFSSFIQENASNRTIRNDRSLYIDQPYRRYSIIFSGCFACKKFFLTISALFKKGRQYFSTRITMHTSKEIVYTKIGHQYGKKRS